MSAYMEAVEQLVETERMLVEASRRLATVKQYVPAAEHYISQVGMNRAERGQAYQPIEVPDVG